MSYLTSGASNEELFVTDQKSAQEMYYQYAGNSLINKNMLRKLKRNDIEVGQQDINMNTEPVNNEDLNQIDFSHFPKDDISAIQSSPLRIRDGQITNMADSFNLQKLKGKRNI